MIMTCLHPMDSELFICITKYTNYKIWINHFEFINNHNIIVCIYLNVGQLNGMKYSSDGRAEMYLLKI